MPQFVIPQFIDVESKLIGPITVRQFILGVVVLLVIFLSYRFADFGLFIIETLFLLSFYILVAFVKVHGVPFYYFILNIISSLKKPALRIWNKEGVRIKVTNQKDKDDDEGAEDEPAVPRIRKKLAEQQLSNLVLLVDTGGRYRPEEILLKKKK